MKDTGGFVDVYDWGGIEGRAKLVSVSLCGEDWNARYAVEDIEGDRDLVFHYCRPMLLEISHNKRGSALYVEERYADEVIAMLKKWEEGEEEMVPYGE
tara:strand:- start:21664 stop:21957 length:294 start_codon:yes stop_codon:yes gene_type:complete